MKLLEPGNRRTFLDTLSPPEGYRFDRALGTTFTLDLMTLLSVPLAFTFRDAHDYEGEVTSGPLALLESARRHANKIVVFCHGGQTAVPRPGQTALAFLEQSVITAFPPTYGETGAVFHPKVWVLRYESQDGPIKYRLICQSRNLTFDKSWDASLVLDGALNDNRVRGYPINRPLTDFIRALPSLSPSALSGSQQQIVDTLIDELPRVLFHGPEGLTLERFMPFGVSRRNDRFPGHEHRPLLVVSPFLDGDRLLRTAARRTRSVLVSRRESLLKAPHDAVEAFDEVYAFREGLEPETEDMDAGTPPLAGLHAKVYVVDDGWDARVFVGSANATSAALSNPPRNVEFMVELVGKKSRFGIETMLSPSADRSAGAFRSLIEPFEAEAGSVDPDDDALQLDRILDAATGRLTQMKLSGNVEESSEGLFTLRLECSEPLRLASEVVAVRGWPATLPSSCQKPLEDGVEFSNLSLVQLSAFLALEVHATANDKTDFKRFVRTIALEGVPEDRLQVLLARMLQDRSQLMRLLWLLLVPNNDMSFGELGKLPGAEEANSRWGASLPGLLEQMLETLGRDPSRLEPVASLLEDLRRTEAGRELLGVEFDAVWHPIWAVRGKMVRRRSKR